MTAAAIKRADRRAENAELKAAGVCIDCYEKHSTGFMRCVPCGDRNRGGPRKFDGDPVARLARLNAVDISTMSRHERRQVYHAKRYCQQLITRAETK